MSVFFEKLKLYAVCALYAFAPLAFMSCSFDYGTAMSAIPERPDLIMNDVEYVRVQDGEPLVRFHADAAEQYEEKQLMELDSLEFEQFYKQGSEVNVRGSVGAAQVEINTGNVAMEGGVRIDVSSDDLSISTDALTWRNDERVVKGSAEGEVRIERSDGTSFIGRGFSANAREQTFAFDGGIEGVYFEEGEGESE